MFDIINKPLGFVLEFIAGLTGGSFAAAVFIFTHIKEKENYYEKH